MNWANKRAIYKNTYKLMHENWLWKKFLGATVYIYTFVLMNTFQ